MDFSIRPERPADAQIFRQVAEAAFAAAEHSTGTEGAIIDALRAANALTVSLVATINDDVVGHIAFSPVTIDGADADWFGLGPVSVRPDLQGQGIGSALIHEGLDRLKIAGAKGCAVLGNPNYYGRFGFEHDPAFRFEGLPPEYFMRLSLDGSLTAGRVAYHEGFSAL